LREGASQLLQQALEDEIQERLSLYEERKTSDGRSGVVRNGYLPERSLQTGIGPVTIKVPKIASKDSEPVTFQSALVPPY